MPAQAADTAATVGTCRGAMPRTASAIFAMCGGVVPQQPPTMLNKPARPHSRELRRERFRRLGKAGREQRIRAGRRSGKR